MNYLCKNLSRIITVMLLSLIFSCNLDTFSDPDHQVLLESEEYLVEDSPVNANMRLGNLFFEEFFSGNSAFLGQSHQFAGSHSFQITKDPLSGSNKVGKFELRYNDKNVKGSKRAEVGFRELLREGWYSYSVYFPTSGFSRDQYPEIISQWHQEGGGSPPSMVQIQDDEIYFRAINRSDTRDNSNKVYTDYSLGKIQRGKWNEFVFHIVHSPNSDGLIEIWHNKSKVHTIKGPNIRRGYPMPAFKVGIYKWTWSSRKTNTDRRIVYFDNVRVGNERASLTDFISGALKPVEDAIGGIIGGTNNGLQTGSGSEIITGFNLIQANVDRDLGSISNGKTISSQTHKLSIRANTSSGFKGEVRFKLTGANNHNYVDSSPPFALFGDDGRGDYFFGSGLRRGSYTLEATPYLKNEKAGKTATVKFIVNN